MRLEATLARDTLIRVIRQTLPLRIDLGSGATPNRYLLLADPTEVDLVAASGLRLACRAEVRWPVLGLLDIPVHARSLSVLLRPALSQRGAMRLLVFRLQIERSDIAGLPAGVEEKLRVWVNRALDEHDVELAWNLHNTFDRAIGLPALLTSLTSLDLALTDASVEVTSDAFKLQIALDPNISRTAK